MRLMKFRNELERLPVYVIPISHHFLFEQEMQFIDAVTKFIKEFKPSGMKESGAGLPEAQVPAPTERVRSGGSDTIPPGRD